MRLNVDRQWVGAIMADDLELVRVMVGEQPALANSSHPEFDDPFQAAPFPVQTILFAAAGPPPQQLDWRAVERVPQINLVRLLLELGADPNADGAHGLPLCFVRQDDVARCLMEFGGDMNRWSDNSGSPLFCSVWNADPDRLRLQIRLGIDVQLGDPRTGESALHCAACQQIEAEDQESDLLEVSRLLISSGLDVNLQTKDGVVSPAIAGQRILRQDTALHLAAAYGPASLVRLLRDSGADADLVNEAGQRPLDCAMEAGRPRSVVDLLK